MSEDDYPTTTAEVLRKAAEYLDVVEPLLVKLAEAQGEEYEASREVQEDLLALAEWFDGHLYQEVRAWRALKHAPRYQHLHNPIGPPEATGTSGG